MNNKSREPQNLNKLKESAKGYDCDPWNNNNDYLAAPDQPTCCFDPALIQNVLDCIGELKEQIACCETYLFNIGRAVFSPTFGLSEIKSEVSFIETTVSDIRTEVTSTTYGLQEIKSEVSAILGMMMDRKK